MRTARGAPEPAVDTTPIENLYQAMQRADRAHPTSLADRAKAKRLALDSFVRTHMQVHKIASGAFVLPVVRNHNRNTTSPFHGGAALTIKNVRNVAHGLSRRKSSHGKVFTTEAKRVPQRNRVQANSTVGNFLVTDAMDASRYLVHLPSGLRDVSQMHYRINEPFYTRDGSKPKTHMLLFQLSGKVNGANGEAPLTQPFLYVKPETTHWRNMEHIARGGKGRKNAGYRYASEKDVSKNNNRNKNGLTEQQKEVLRSLHVNRQLTMAMTPLRRFFRRT